MSIRAAFLFGVNAWAACVTGHITDSIGAPIDDAKIALESRAGGAVQAEAGKDGRFRVCADESGEDRIVLKRPGFRPRTAAAFLLRQDVEVGAIEMMINADEIVCNLPILTSKDQPYPYFDASDGFVSFTGRDGKRRKFPRNPNDRQHNLDGDWKRVVFLRGNEIWVDNRRVYTHNALMWDPEFVPAGKSIRFWSTTWKDGDRQFTVPIQGR